MLPEYRTVGALLAHLAQAMPEQEAVVWPPRPLTYAGLYAQAAAVPLFWSFAAAAGMGNGDSRGDPRLLPGSHRQL